MSYESSLSRMDGRTPKAGMLQDCLFQRTLLIKPLCRPFRRKENPMTGNRTLLKREDCLLVMIDVQEKLFPAVHERDKVKANLIRLVKFSRVVDLPVMVTEQENLGATLPEISREIPEFNPVRKITFDCFACPAFQSLVKRSGKPALVVAGLESHICVAQTALSGLKNHRVQVVTDAVSSRSVHNRETAIQRLSMAGVELTTTEMFLYEILQQAGTEAFRAVLPLVKDDSKLP